MNNLQNNHSNHGQPAPRPEQAMESSVRLGQVWGIPVGLHWSWFAIFALVTWSLASSYYPRAYPQLGRDAAWVLGAVTALLFFGSVLLHELGHAWMARRYGIEVKGISLFLFGGVAQLGGEAKTPRQEFKIAAAGPLVSFALAAFFEALWVLDRSVPLLAAPSDYLARINLALGLFNLIPGFPLDGGRMLRAWVWKSTGDKKRADAASLLSGQVVALGFIGWGIATMIGGSVANGLWLVLIGWFLQNAVAAHFAGAALAMPGDPLKGVTVGHVMGAHAPQVPSGATLEEIIRERVLVGGESTFVVADEGRVRGLLSLREIVAVPPEERATTTAEKAMLPWHKLINLHPGMDANAALKMMAEARLEQNPVLDGDRIAGLLSHDHLMRYLRVRSQLGV